MKQEYVTKPEHILQLQCYYTIFSELIPINNLNLIYIDMNDIIAYIAPKRNLVDWITRRIQEIEDAIVKCTTPIG